AYDLEEEVTSNFKLYASWEIVNYTVTYNLNGGEFIYPAFKNKAEMMEAFMADFYDFVKPEESLEVFKHGEGNTSGYTGTWHATHSAKIYARPKPEAVDENFFASSSKYMMKWMPFFDHLHFLTVQTNNTQYFWGASNY